MPTYEYRCNACRREFEYQQRMADDDLVTCEACGEPKLEKLISRTAFQLKGGGWYKDLYASTPAAAPSGDKPAATTDTPAAAAATPAAAPSTSSDSGSSSGSSTPSTPAASSSGSSGSGGTSST